MWYIKKIVIMQISENLLRVIFMLSTIVAVTDCCSSRLLLLKEHTLQIVQHRLPNTNIGDDTNYGYDDKDQLQQQQRQQQQLEQEQQQQKIPQYVGILNGDIEFNKNSTDEHTRSRDDSEENSTDTNILVGALELRDFGMDSFESLFGIFDAAAFETTTTTEMNKMRATTAESLTTTSTTTMSRTTTEEATTTETSTASWAMTTTVATMSTPATTTATQRSTTSQADEISTQKTSNVAANEFSATTKTPTSSEVINEMNNLKTAGDLLSLPCSGTFNTEFCLNRGRCFRYPIGNDTIHSCICADGYIGERCESKSMNGSFIPSIAGAHKKKIVMARIVFSFPMLMAISAIYIMIGAAIVFKRPPAFTDTEIPPVPTPPSSARSSYSRREAYEPWSAEDVAGEFIMMNTFERKKYLIYM